MSTECQENYVGIRKTIYEGFSQGIQKIFKCIKHTLNKLFFF